MKPIVNLDDICRMCRDDLLKTAVAITCDMRHFRVIGQPVSEYFCFTVRQKVNGTMAYGITNQNTVPVTFFPGEIINTDKRGCGLRECLWCESDGAVYHDSPACPEYG